MNTEEEARIAGRLMAEVEHPGVLLIVSTLRGWQGTMTPEQRLALFTAITEGYCTACGEALEMIDTGGLGMLPRVCHCENDE